MNIIGTKWEHSGKHYDRMIAGKKFVGLLDKLGNFGIWEILSND